MLVAGLQVQLEQKPGTLFQYMNTEPCPNIFELSANREFSEFYHRVPETWRSIRSMFANALDKLT